MNCGRKSSVSPRRPLDVRNEVKQRLLIKKKNAGVEDGYGVDNKGQQDKFA